MQDTTTHGNRRFTQPVRRNAKELIAIAAGSFRRPDGTRDYDLEVAYFAEHVVLIERLLQEAYAKLRDHGIGV